MDRIVSNHKRSKIPVPKLFDWKEYYNATDFVNTPTLMAVYISQATCEYFNSKGGIEYYEDLALAKAATIYKGIDDSKLFECFVEPELRSS
jgi:phosphoserine aminotransferase